MARQELEEKRHDSQGSTLHRRNSGRHLRHGVLQNIGTDVWIARGLGAVTAAFVGVLGNYLFLRGKPESSPDTRERAEHRNGVQGR